VQEDGDSSRLGCYSEKIGHSVKGSAVYRLERTIQQPGVSARLPICRLYSAPKKKKNFRHKRIANRPAKLRLGVFVELGSQPEPTGRAVLWPRVRYSLTGPEGSYAIHDQGREHPVLD
jgi:hypothetical protein